MDSINKLCCVCITDEQRRVHNCQVENRRIRRAVMDTAKDTAQREKTIQIAKALLASNVPLEIIVSSTELTLEEVLILQNGGDLREPEE